MQSSIGTIRGGQRGTIGELDRNGFAQFTSTTGAVFTVHGVEFIADSATPAEHKAARARWASWPLGDLRIAIERKRGRSPSLIVQRLAGWQARAFNYNNKSAL